MDAAVIAAALSAVATALAAFATWKAPITAARIAETLRRDSAAADERRRLRLHVFATLMSERKTLWSPEAVRTLNLIDVVFHDSRPVRDAWAELFASYDSNRRVPEHIQDERANKLLLAMAADLGLADGLRPDDLTRVYFPQTLWERAQIEMLERRAYLRRLQGGDSPSGNVTPSSEARDAFPPRPS